MPQTQKIILYGYSTSPFVRKTADFLYYKQLEFTHIPANPIVVQDYLIINPLGK